MVKDNKCEYGELKHPIRTPKGRLRKCKKKPRGK